MACNKPKSDSNNSTSGTQANLSTAPIEGDFRFRVGSITKEVTILQYIGTKKDVTIPATIDGNPVTAIGDDAFSSSSLPNNLRITSVKFEKPETINTIGQGAFANTDIDEIDLSKTKITEISNGTFENITVGGTRDNPTGATLLRLVLLPTSITRIGDNAFKGCVLLNSMDLSKLSQLSTIGMGAFAGCAFTSVDISNTRLTRIPEAAFLACTKLRSIQLPLRLTHIGAMAFQLCSALTSLDLTNVTQLSVIDDNAFSDCLQLAEIRFATIGNTQLTKIGESAFLECTALTKVDLSKQTNLTSIGKLAFNGCTKLSSLIFPSSITRMGVAVYSNTSRASSYAIINVRIEATTPPNIVQEPSSSSPLSAIIVAGNPNSKISVPAGFAHSYQDAIGWKNSCGGNNTNCIQGY